MDEREQPYAILGENDSNLVNVIKKNLEVNTICKFFCSFDF